jgi:hypothetical protein
MQNPIFEAAAWNAGWRVAILDGRRCFVRDPAPNELNKFDPVSGKILADTAFPDWTGLCEEFEISP